MWIISEPVPHWKHWSPHVLTDRLTRATTWTLVTYLRRGGGVIPPRAGGGLGGRRRRRAGVGGRGATHCRREPRGVETPSSVPAESASLARSRAQLHGCSQALSPHFFFFLLWFIFFNSWFPPRSEKRRHGEKRRNSKKLEIIKRFKECPEREKRQDGNGFEHFENPHHQIRELVILYLNVFHLSFLFQLCVISTISYEIVLVLNSTGGAAAPGAAETDGQKILSIFLNYDCNNFFFF